MPINEWLADIANRIVHEEQQLHRKPNDCGIIYAGAVAFEQAFEIPLQIYRQQIRYELQEEYNRKMNSAIKEMPNFGVDAMKTLGEIKELYFQLARRDNPDVR